MYWSSFWLISILFIQGAISTQKWGSRYPGSGDLCNYKYKQNDHPRWGSRYPNSGVDHCDNQGEKPFTLACDDGWTGFQRAKGLRCLRVFQSAAINQSSAEALCQKDGGTLAGLENRAEGIWMNDQALPFRPVTTGIEAYRDIWIGGHRKPECMKPPYAATCYPADKQMLYWTDPSVTGTDGFTAWWWLNPDNVYNIQSCLWLTVQKEDSLNNVYKTQKGSIADVQCEGVNQDIFGYACSKPPTKKVYA